MPEGGEEADGGGKGSASGFMTVAAGGCSGPVALRVRVRVGEGVGQWLVEAHHQLLLHLLPPLGQVPPCIHLDVRVVLEEEHPAVDGFNHSGRKEEGRREREEGRGKREEGRGNTGVELRPRGTCNST